MLTSLRLYIGLLGEYLRPHRFRVALLAFVIVSATGLQLAAPQFIRQFFDSAQEHGELSPLYVAAALYLGVGLFGRVMTEVSYYLGTDVGWRTTNRLRSDLTRHVLKLDMSFHNDHPPGELIERIDGDVERIANFFSQMSIVVIGGALMVVGVLAVAWLEDWRYGLVMLGGALLDVTLRPMLLRISVPWWRRENEARAGLYGFLEERISGIEDIQSNGGAGYTMRRFREVMRKRFWTVVQAYCVSNIVAGAGYTSSLVFYTGILAAGIYLVQSDAITLWTAYLMYHYWELMYGPIERIMYEIEDLQRARVSIERVKELLETESAVKDGALTLTASDKPAVAFDRVSFSYHSEANALDDVSFRLEPGTTLGLLGRTGSGKTTMARLLLRLYDPTQGTVRFDDFDVRQAPIADLRGRVGLVTQEVQLFQASVRDNLNLFGAGASDDRIVDTLGLLGLDAWYRSLPDGLDTEMAPGGGQLSAGEAQMLAFARVFLKDPDVVVLDEASSRLDPATERMVDRGVQTLLKDRTAVVIAHRLSTVDRVDRIMILDGGRIQEHGARDALAADPSSRFSHLLRTGMEEVLA